MSRLGRSLLILSAIISSLLFSCKRQSLEEPFYFLAHVPVSIDWSESLLKERDIANVSICAFPVDGGQAVRLLSDNIYFNVLELPVGEYNILVYNELLGDVKGLGSSGVGAFDEIRSHVLPMANPSILYDKLLENDMVVENHNIISTWVMRNFEVTSEMVELTRSESFVSYIEESRNNSRAMLYNRSAKLDERVALPPLPEIPATGGSRVDVDAMQESLESLSKVSPKSENTILRFKVRTKNLNNAMKVEALLRGVEYGAYLASDRHEVCEGRRVVYVNIVRNRVYDNPTNGVDGYFSLAINTFGEREDGERCYIDLNCALNDGRVLKFSFDITDSITEGGESKDLTIDLGDIDNPAITLPPCGEPGFNVGDWDDEIIVDIL